MPEPTRTDSHEVTRCRWATREPNISYHDEEWGVPVHDDRTWFEHWLPRVFEASLSAETLRELESPEVVAEHKEFMKLKRRPDREFWLGLLRQKEPENLRAPIGVFALGSSTLEVRP